MKSLKIKIAAALFFALPILNACTTPNNNEITQNSQRIKVTSLGTGDDIILIPGLGSPPDVYNGIKDELAKTHRVHLVHLNGYAGLPLNDETSGMFNPAANAIADYIKVNNLKNPSLIGHSMGGELAMAINARNPDLIKKILVVDAFTYYSLLFGANSTPETMMPRAKAFAAMVKLQSPEQYEAAQKIAIARLVKDEAKRAMVLDWSIKSNRYAIAQGVEDLMTIDLRPELKNNKAKIQLIYGYDAMMGLTQEYVDNLYANAYKDIPNSNIKRIDNSLHFIMYDQPEAFKSAVLDFVK